MAQFNLKVSLTTDGKLDVEDLPEGAVPRGGDHLIRWYLDPDTLAGSYFDGQGKGSSAPFGWIDSPKWYVFHHPEVVEDGRALQMEDHHPGSSTAGSFVYVIRVRKDKAGAAEYYSTTHSNSGNIRTTDNPVIINH